MQQMTALEALVIAHWYALIAREFSNAAGLPGLTPQQVGDLTTASNTIAAQSSNLATNAAQVAFNNAGQAFQDISDVASQAARAAKVLAAQAGRINDLLHVAQSVISFATAALAGNYGAALASLVALVGKPQAGQGANDPLS